MPVPYLPAVVRKALYYVLFLSVVVIGALTIADVDTGKANDIVFYVGGALGLLAASKTKDLDEH